MKKTDKTTSKMFRMIKKFIIILTGVFLVLLLGLSIYANQSYTSLPEMETAISDLDLSEVSRVDNINSISYIVPNPLANIIFIPGGLVEPDSYTYLAASLAREGYNVTIVKAMFNLAIFTPNKASRYIDDEMDNIIIGHSLGGVVASMVALKHDEISKVIMLGSYPIKDLTSKETLMITAEHDDGMDPIKFNESLIYVNEENIIYNIEGGNHAQFGWYGPQKGDGEADMSTLEQQQIVITQILDFIEE